MSSSLLGILMASFFGSLFDPVRWIGEIAAGTFIRSLWGALVCGAGWSLLVSLFVGSHGAASAAFGSAMLITSPLAGLLVTAISYRTATRIRIRRAGAVANAEQRED